MTTTCRGSPQKLDFHARWARVTGTHGPFVLFDFTIADPDLTVELIMPYPAFTEFCRDNRAVLAVHRDAAEPFERLKRQAERDGRQTLLSTENPPAQPASYLGELFQ